MNWGVLPICYEGVKEDDAKLAFGLERCKELGYVKADDIVISTAGFHQQAGGTDSIRVMRIEDK